MCGEGKSPRNRLELVGVYTGSACVAEQDGILESADLMPVDPGLDTKAKEWGTRQIYCC